MEHETKVVYCELDCNSNDDIQAIYEVELEHGGDGWDCVDKVVTELGYTLLIFTRAIREDCE